MAQDIHDGAYVNFGIEPVTLRPGGAYFHHADSFAMMRGGHLDICLLGALQVSATGDLANWSTGEPGAIPAVGGAMDLAIGARQTWVMMEDLDAAGDDAAPQTQRGQGRHQPAFTLASTGASPVTSCSRYSCNFCGRADLGPEQHPRRF